MRKYLSLALATAVIVISCTDAESIIRADTIELIHVDTQAQTINVTVSADGKRSTIVLTPRAALQMQSELGRTMALMVESAEALRAQSATDGP